jgi:mannose/fructose-specific phosphotransferase system component IIA
VRTEEAAVRPFDVLIASHGSVAASLVEAAGMICGDASLQGVSAVGLEPDDSPESYLERLRAQVDGSRSTLILTDLYGGTPHNVACTLARREGGEIRCISGANLAIVIEALTTTDPLDDALVERLIQTTREAVVDATDRLATQH